MIKTMKMLYSTVATTFFIVSVLIALVGCDSAAPARTQQTASVAPNDSKIDLPGPKPDPSRDEAGELIKVCGAPSSDIQKSVEGGTQRILAFHHYGVDIFFLQNTTDSPKWASTAVFAGENNINRKALSRKMPCSKKMSLYSVDVLDPYLFSH